MSLAEEVPYLRWRTTQLAQFELTFAVKDVMGKVMSCGGGVGWCCGVMRSYCGAVGIVIVIAC